MKKIIVPVAIVVVLLVAFIVSIPLVNDLCAKNVEKQLIEVTLPDNTERIEALSMAGKLVGNGNGMQYFGAMLIRSEQTLDELSAYYSQKLANFVVKEQNTQRIECVTNESLSFKTTITDTESYYIVYLFGDGISPFSELDIRGH